MTKLERRLTKMPKGKPTVDAVEKSGILDVLPKFNRMAEMVVRCRAAKVPVCETLGVKPWASPTCETITEEQYALLEAACAKAEAQA